MKNKFSIKYIDKETILFEGEYLHPTFHGGDDCCRLIFMTDKYVIKCDNWRDEYCLDEQCKQEFENYQRIKGTDYEKFFVPILQTGKIKKYTYNIQPLVDVVYDKPDWAIDDANEIANKFGLVDIHENNFTINGDDILIFDYAF